MQIFKIRLVTDMGEEFDYFVKAETETAAHWAVEDRAQDFNLGFETSEGLGTVEAVPAGTDPIMILDAN